MIIKTSFVQILFKQHKQHIHIDSVYKMDKSYLLQNVFSVYSNISFVEKLITWTEGISSESQKFPVIKMIVASMKYPQQCGLPS